MSHPYDKTVGCKCTRCTRERNRRLAQTVQSRLGVNTPEQRLYRAIFGDGVNRRRQRQRVASRTHRAAEVSGG